MKIVAVTGQKGGVGKTTAAMSLAAVLAESQPVLLVDTDPQQSAAWWAGRAREAGTLPFDVAPDRDPDVLAFLRRRAKHYTAVVVDTPGSLQDEAVLTAVLDNTDYAVLPVEPAALAVRPLEETVQRLIRPRQIAHRVLLNKVDSRWRDVTDMRVLLDKEQMPTFTTAIRLYKAHASAPLDGLVVTGYGTDVRARNAADDYRKVALEMVADWGKRG